MSSAALEIRGLCKSFGALNVTSNVNLSLEVGARSALIGPNGAGKTTLINLMTGSLPPSTGTVLLNGHDLSHASQAERVQRGMVRTFQITRLFRSLTVADNLRMAILQRPGVRWGLFRPAHKVEGLDAEVEAILALLNLRERASRKVSELAYGEQRLIELGLALCLKPKVLLLDEPAAGVPQSETEVIVRAVEQLPKDLAVLLIEHDMDLVFRLARHITVLVSGAVLMQGTPQEVTSDERVQTLYLGESHGRH